MGKLVNRIVVSSISFVCMCACIGIAKTAGREAAARKDL